MSITLIPLDEVIYFDEITADPTQEGSPVSDADSTPTFEVFEEATDTPILAAQSFTKRTSKTGNYRGTFTCSTANGFEAGKCYSVTSSATVGGVAGKKVSLRFRIGPAEVAAGVPVVQLSALGVDDIWDEIMEATLTARQSWRLANAANAGKASGMGTTAAVLRNYADTLNRITATVDDSGNRTAVTVNLG